MAEWPVGGFDVAYPYEPNDVGFYAYQIAGALFSIEQGQPSPDDVRAGVVFGSQKQFTGTLVASGGGGEVITIF